MTWLKTDDKYPEHRKVRRLTDGAYRLHHTAMCACAKDETDGLVTESDISDMEHGTRLRKHVDALVAAGLWDVVPAGWIIHDYLDYNPSHASLNAKRAADRERQEKYRKGRLQEPVTYVSQRDNGVTDALSQPPVPDPYPSRPALYVAGSALGIVAESNSNRPLLDARVRDGLELA